MEYPIGIQTFEQVVKGGFSYVDKTAFVYKLAHYAKVQFLSRPRRFGKSLFVSTLQAYFEGKKELFKGLAIEKLEQEWKQYPVIHIDLSSGKYYRLKNVHVTLNRILSRYEKYYHVEVDANSLDVYSSRLEGIISAAAEQSGENVVVLIDEYDAPMHDSMNDPDMQDEIRNIMRDFFSPLKYQDANLRFVFITGISKFSQLSIFSELNSLKNISMKPEYACICGFTEEEMSSKFKDGIRQLAEKQNFTYEDCMSELRRQYDGYHFTASSPGIYNPFSIINALDDKEMNAYWFSSGTPTFLIELLQKKGYDMLQLSDLWASESRFNVPTDKITDPIPVLYQSGYLTIKDYNPDTRQYLLDFPNEEVRKGFSESLFRYYAPDQAGSYDKLVAAYVRDIVKNDDMEAFMPHLKAFYDKFPYTLVNNNERHYQAVMYTIFSMLGAEVQPEVLTSDGRIDLVLKTVKSIYVIELKCDKTANVAIEQIKDRNYVSAFVDDARVKHLVGINFSKDQRTIDDWSVK